MSSKTQSKQRGKIQPLKTVARLNASSSRNVHTPCKLQRWSSVQSASSGLFEPSASSVHSLTGSLHASVFPRMLRIPALDHSGRFVCSVFPPCVLLSLDSRLEMFVDGRFEFHGSKNMPRIVWFWSRNSFFFRKKNPIRCDFLLFRLVGWLVVMWYYF